MQLYRELGLKLEPTSNLVESGILEVWQRMSTGRLKVFPTLTHFLEELRSYRRDENGQIVTEYDGLQNATRCLVMTGIARMRLSLVKEPTEPLCTGYGADGWMAI